MIIVANKTLNSKSVTNALQKLYDSENFTGTAQARIGKFAHHVIKAQRAFQREMAELIKGAAKPGKDGLPKTTKEGNFVWKSKADEKKYMAKFSKLLEEKVEIPAKKISVSDIPRGVISANELQTIAFFVDGVEEIKD